MAGSGGLVGWVDLSFMDPSRWADGWSGWIWRVLCSGHDWWMDCIQWVPWTDEYDVLPRGFFETNNMIKFIYPHHPITICLLFVKCYFDSFLSSGRNFEVGCTISNCFHGVYLFTVHKAFCFSWICSLEVRTFYICAMPPFNIHWAIFYAFPW